MRKNIFVSFLLCFLVAFYSPSAYAESCPSTKTISEIICHHAPLSLGYVDNTEYYVQHYFSEIPFVDDCSVVVSRESTNFNEIGVFHVSNPKDVKTCEKRLREYLKNAKERFKSGVVYDIEQYPKFENARVTVLGQYVIYTILDRAESQTAIKNVKNYLQK